MTLWRRAGGNERFTFGSVKSFLDGSEEGSWKSVGAFPDFHELLDFCLSWRK